MLKPFFILALMGNLFSFNIAADVDSHNKCGDNEILVKCPETVCVPKTCDEVGYPVPCIDLPPDGKCPSKPACICKENYVRDSRGICIPMKDCPCCGGDPNAVSGCGVNCGKRCADYFGYPQPCKKICYYNSCDCRDGFYYDDNINTCVPPKECTYCNKPNEEYTNCTHTCPPKTCESLDRLYKCPVIDKKSCKRGCQCKRGYYRNLAGECVSEAECRKCSGPNEYYSCNSRVCDKKCKNLNEKDKICKDQCFCQKGYVRALNNTCIPISCCDEPKCGVNEKYDKNPSCQPRHCSDLGYKLDCQGSKHPLKPACVCIDGYVKDHNGVCIPIKHCPSCGGDKNAEAGCGVNCNKHCSDIGKEPGGCILICYENACDCKKGFYYDKNLKKCVPPKECTHCNRPNEEYTNCTYNCPPQTCESLDKIYICPISPNDKKACKSGCRCKRGHFRNLIGECISEAYCRKCPGANEYYSCNSRPCDKRCKNLNENLNKLCKDQCFCQNGYARALNNTCIPISCCGEPQCGINEKYEKNPTCQARHCSELGYKLDCQDPKHPLKPGCYCIDGYVRDHNGVCIPKRHCPSCGGDKNAVSGCGVNCNKHCSDIGKEPGGCIRICYENACDCKKDYYYDDKLKKCVPPEQCKACTKPHEVVYPCPSNCPPQTCESIGKIYHCPLNNSSSCKPACKCKKGHYRNKIGECISEKDCLKCTGKHEYFSCGGACDNVCATIHKQNQTHCPIVNIVCNKMCYCEKGYARAKNNTCIPINCCNEPQCPLNEHYEECPERLCGPQYCSELGYPLKCPDPNCPCSGKPTCVCDVGYVRNDKGVCIRQQDCPSCGGDKNAMSGCGFECGKHCEDLPDDKPRPCPLICRLNGCQCRPGKYYDKDIKKCVDPKDCCSQYDGDDDYDDDEYDDDDDDGDGDDIADKAVA